MKAPLYLFFAFLSFHASTISAQQSPHTLLWRISGRNGAKPSYLYGTMHLTDERLFNLGDSLYEAIRQTDGFATELDPNDLSAFVLEEVKKEIIDVKNIREVLSEKDYKLYSARLAKKMKMSADKITTRDILREKNKWMSEKYKTGKMKTFLDVYLYDIARRQGKWTGGIEDMDDQRGLVDDVVDKSDIKDLLAEDNAVISRETENMIGIYLRQDLDGIDSMSNGNGIDPIMLRRNKKMSGRIDSLSAVRPMVFAVGAAHLPGELGLIELLRKRGFQVDPVFSDKHIQAANYKVEDVSRPWSTVTDEDGFYEATMPGKPENMQLYGIMNMKIYIDLFNGTAYFTTAVKSAINLHGSDSLIDEMAKNMFHSKGNTYKPIVLNGAKGRMYSVNDDDGFKKGMIFLKEGVLYLAMATSTKIDSQQLKLMDQFITGFKILELSKKETAVTLFSDPSMAFRVEVPGNPKVYEQPKKKTTEDWTTKMFISVDNQAGIYYLFGVNYVRQGRFIENDSTFFIQLKNTVLKNFSSVSQDTGYFSNGYRVIQFNGKMKAADAWMTARYLPRGNRWYALVAIYPTEAAAGKISAFLQSFSMLDYPQQSWKFEQSPDTLFKSWLPSPLLTEKPDSSSSADIDHIYNSFDSSRSNSYSVVISHLNPYYWSISDSAFWAELVSSHIQKTDSLFYKKTVSNGDAKGWEWMKVKRGSKMYERQRLLLNGDQFYSLFVCTPESEIHSDNTNRFFEDFRFQNPPAKTSYMTSKADTLLEALYMGDSAHATMAFDYLKKAPFNKDDIALLHQFFFKIPSFKSNRISFSQINDAITQKVISVKDSSSFRFAAENYRRITDAEDSAGELKMNLLRIMVAFRDTAHFTPMANLLSASPPRNELSYAILRSLKDTMELTAKIMPTLLPLITDSLVGGSIINLTVSLLDSNRLSLQEMLPYQTGILRYAAFRAKTLAGKSTYSYHDLPVVKLLGYFNNTKSNAALKRFLAAKENYIRIKAVDALLKNKQPIDPAVYLSLAKDKASRLSLFDVLDKAGKAALFPVEFRTQKMFAQSKIYEQAADDEEPYSLVYVAMKPAVIKGVKRIFYFYAVKMDEEGNAYLSCAGPYGPNPLRYNPAGITVESNQDDPFSEANREEQMNKLILLYQQE